MFCSCVPSPVTVNVNTLACKRSELIGNAAIVRKLLSIIYKSRPACACVFREERLEAQERKVDLWQAFENTNTTGR